MRKAAVLEEASAVGENADFVKKEEKDSIRLMRAELSEAPPSL